MSAIAKRHNTGPLARWVGFKVAGRAYALEILRVQEVLGSVQIEPVPGAPAAVLGVINLRGRIVPVVDVQYCLGYGMANQAASVIVVDSQGESLGLRVEGITEIHSIPAAAIQPVPAASGAPCSSPMLGIVSRDHSMLTLLDVDRLVGTAAAELAAIEAF
jgi:purine-binding chemotaxis protein CheW